jgi:hypothetical protein
VDAEAVDDERPWSGQVRTELDRAQEAVLHTPERQSALPSQCFESGDWVTDPPDECRIRRMQVLAEQLAHRADEADFAAWSREVAAHEGTFPPGKPKTAEASIVLLETQPLQGQMLDDDLGLAAFASDRMHVARVQQQDRCHERVQ